MGSFKNGDLVILKDSYKKEIEEKAKFFSSDPKNRPLVVSFEDKKIKGLKWAIPLTTKKHLSNEKINKIESMMNSKSIVENYYEEVKIMGNYYYAKVRDIKPISDDYIDHSFTKNNRPLAVTNTIKLNNLEEKVKKVISINNRNPEKFEQNLNETKKLVVAHLEELTKEKDLDNDGVPDRIDIDDSRNAVQDVKDLDEVGINTDRTQKQKEKVSNTRGKALFSIKDLKEKSASKDKEAKMPVKKKEQSL